MGIKDFSEILYKLEQEHLINIDPDEELIHQALQLRYQSYCVENNFTTGQNGIETDEFDTYSKHLVLLNKKNKLVGTVRLVLYNPADLVHSFPIQQLIQLPSIPFETTAEISRFTIPKQSRGLLRLLLLKGILKLSRKLQLTHWIAVMEPSFFRLLATMGIYFQVSELVDYHGPRQSCFNNIDELLQKIYEEQPKLWQYFTDEEQPRASQQ